MKCLSSGFIVSFGDETGVFPCVGTPTSLIVSLGRRQPFDNKLTLKVLVTTFDALGHF